MTAGGRTRASIAVLAVASACFAAAAHFALLDDLPPALGAVLSMLPVFLLAAWLARRARRPWLTATVVLALAGGAWLEWGELLRSFPHLFFVEHAGANLVLAVVFGRTLAAGHEPLCTSFARLLHGALPDEVVRYTRAVTVAWTLFFAATFALSCALYLSHQLGAWSLFANIVSPVLLVAMFPIEYAVRHRVLPDWERVGVLGSIRAFSRYFAAPQAGTPR